MECLFWKKTLQKKKILLLYEEKRTHPTKQCTLPWALKCLLFPTFIYLSIDIWLVLLNHVLLHASAGAVLMAKSNSHTEIEIYPPAAGHVTHSYTANPVWNINSRKSFSIESIPICNHMYPKRIMNFWTELWISAAMASAGLDQIMRGRNIYFRTEL